MNEIILNLLHTLKEDGYYDSFVGRCKYRYTNVEGNVKGFDYTCASCREGRAEVSEILKGRCPLCNLKLRTLPEPLKKVKWIEWGNRFMIIPNAFPYFENHINFISKNHETQDIIRERDVINTLFSFYESIGKGKWMLFFNHLIGNSLNHFHVHATTQMDMPLVRLIKRKPTSPDFKRVRLFKITTCFKGILVTNPNRTIINKIIQNILPSEMFNFGWFGKYFIIFVRKLSDTPADKLGSTELMGYILSCDMKKIAEYVESCKHAFVSHARMREIIRDI